MSWIEIANQIPFQIVATSCHMATKSSRWGPCPGCNTDRMSDGRPPVNTFRNAQAWVCNSCHIKGDMVDLVSYFVDGNPFREAQNKKAVRQHFEELDGNIDVRTYEYDLTNIQYPPLDEVKKILNAGVRLQDSPGCRRYLASRGIDIHNIGHSYRYPAQVVVASGHFDYGKLTWVERDDKRKPWWPTMWAQHFPLLFPMYDHKGELRSIHGRSITSRTGRKTTAPLAFNSKGLLFLNHKAIDFVSGEPTKTVWITEGEIDFLSLAQYDVPVIGVKSGSMGAVKQLPWAVGIHVYIATDDDQKGDQYAEKLVEAVMPAAPYRVSVSNLGGVQ
jgi:hypothetical protein